MSRPPLAVPSPDALVATLDAEAVLLDLASKQYFQLNPTGTVIWEALSAGCDRDETIARVVAEFEVTAEVAARGIDAFVAELRARGLVTDVPGAR